MSDWLGYLEENARGFEADLLDFLRIPSISALPEHAADVRRAADWTADRLRRAGLEGVQVLPTAGHPVVCGEWLHAAGKPTVLIYGHFDTQPVDPIDQWSHPPFEPHVERGRIYARGASDDKGNMLIPNLAVEALLNSTGSLPINVKFFLEGQEEIGSPHIPDFLSKQRERFACDLVLSADGGQHGEDQPSLSLAFRGLCAAQIDVHGPASDLHSGVYGGMVQNPVHALVQILASMRGTDGRIRIEGFYDDVLPLSSEERERIAAVPFDEAALRDELGVDTLPGEEGFTPRERNWARPTLEVNGIWGGFQGEGIKTVLPAEAHAKITCRLVARQDPARILSLIDRHVRLHSPPGVSTTFRPLHGTAVPYLMPAGHPANRIAAGVLQELYGRAPLHVRNGATIPACELFERLLGVQTLIYAFGLDDERFHAPDEFFRLASFERGQRAYCLLLERLAGAAPAELRGPDSQAALA